MPVAKRHANPKATLTVPQLRILKVLAEAPMWDDHQESYNRDQIAEMAQVSRSMTGNLGPISRAPGDTTIRYGRTNLIDAGYVEVVALVQEYTEAARTKYYYRITAKGLAAYKEHLKSSENPPKTT